jgi:hypothetical protein
MQWFWDCVEWLRTLNWYEALALSAGLFIAGVVGSLAVVSWAVVRLPATYFRKDHAAVFWADKPALVRGVGLVVKNLIGIVLILIGIVLSLPGVPGQGVLTILIGIMFVDFPGKRRLERLIVGRPIVLRALNRLRARYGKPALELDEPVPVVK